MNSTDDLLRSLEAHIATADQKCRHFRAVEREKKIALAHALEQAKLEHVEKALDARKAAFHAEHEAAVLAAEAAKTAALGQEALMAQAERAKQLEDEAYASRLTLDVIGVHADDVAAELDREMEKAWSDAALIAQHADFDPATNVFAASEAALARAEALAQEHDRVGQLADEAEIGQRARTAQLKELAHQERAKTREVLETALQSQARQRADAAAAQARAKAAQREAAEKAAMAKVAEKEAEKVQR